MCLIVFSFHLNRLLNILNFRCERSSKRQKTIPQSGTLPKYQQRVTPTHRAQSHVHTMSWTAARVHALRPFQRQKLSTMKPKVTSDYHPTAPTSSLALLMHLLTRRVLTVYASRCRPRQQSLQNWTTFCSTCNTFPACLHRIRGASGRAPLPPLPH
jgi:hypothetical protein